MKYAIFILLTALGLAPMASAAKSEKMQLTGIAAYSELRRPYYIGALYLDQPVISAGQVLSSWGRRRMEMRITAERWTPRRFSSQWTQALILNADPAQLERFDDAFVSFNNLPRGALRRGDHLVVESDKKGRTRVRLNGTEMFAESTPGFFEVLLSTWIGDKPPSTEFRNAILSNIDQSLMAQYRALQPSDKRTVAVAAWPDGGVIEDPAELEEAAVKEPIVAAVNASQPSGEAQAATADTAAIVAVPTGAAESVATKPELPKPVIKKPTVAPKPVAAAKTASRLAKSITVEDVATQAGARSNKPAVAGRTKVVAMAPSSPGMPLEPEEPAMDPAIFRLQQETLLKLYRSSIIKRALRQVKYPRSSVRRGHEGTVLLELTVDRGGKMLSLETASKTRYKKLNKAAIAAVHDAGSLPAVPAGLEGDNITVSIPVKFTLR